MKNKKEMQAENSLLKEEICKMKVEFSELSEKYINLQKQSSLEIAQDKQVFKCDRCDYISESLTGLKKHKQIHENVIEDFKCGDCGREFDEEWKMSAHEKKHAKIKCNRCDKSFKYLETMKKHEKIAHENTKLYCHYFNNKQTCPFDKDCIFLHEDADKCKYGEQCERILCMFKHAHDPEVHEKEMLTVDNKIEKNVIHLDEEKTRTPEITVIDVHVEDIVTVDDAMDTDMMENDDEQDTNILETEFLNEELVKCKICDFASARKSDLKDHKTTIHNWCFICFSSFNSRQHLKNHFKRAHSKTLGCLELILGEAP